ncbi:MAG: hypothetical protein K6F66_06385, partial [Pseudobutyrivibrio sp.]|nr:hypothetical protein [Pseudobutyrivibrio sp.]
MSRRRRRKRYRIPRGYIYIAAAVIFIAMLVVGIYAIKKYTPTKEHQDLSEYFVLNHENQAAVIVNSEYLETTDDSTYGYAVVNGGQVYLELGFVKDYIDDGYVYDPSEITLRYATDTEVYTATLGSADYTIDKSINSLAASIVLAQDETVYISTEYLQLLSNFTYAYYSEPDRVFVETVGYEKQVATAKGKSQIRVLNGPKS